MRNSFKHILLAGLAVVSAGLTTNAQDLKQDWKSTTDIPAAANARWGAGWDGKVYTNDKSVPEIYTWDETGARAALGVGGGAGVGLSFDAAGNAIIVDGWAGAGSMKSLKIWERATNQLVTVAVTVPEGAAAARMDFTGRAVGDVTSTEGGAVFFAGQGNTSVSKIFIAKNAEGTIAQVAEKSKAIATGIAMDNTTVVQPLTTNPESDEIAVRVRGGKDFMHLDAGTWKPYERVGTINSSAGGDVVTLDGKLYTIEPSGTNYKDGFQIVDRSTNTVVATHEEESAENKQSFGTALNVQKIDEYTARIYQFHCGGMAAQYTFSLPKPMPKLEARNAYAYDINVAEGGENYAVTYRLNAQAESVKVQLWADGEVKKQFDGTTIAEYGEEGKTTVNNLNKVLIPKAEMLIDTKVSFRVAVTSATVAEPTLNDGEYSFWSPYGVAVNNDPNSESFGRIIVTEAQSSLPASGYHSSTENDGVGTGLYAFDPTFKPLKNAEGKHGFKLGLTMADVNEKYPNGRSAIYDLKRLQFSDDGRLFVSRASTKATSLYEVDPNDLNTPAIEIFKGNRDETTGIVTTADGQFVAGPATAMSVTGKGEDLAVAIVSCAGGYALDPKAHRVDVYSLGTAKEWAEAPTQEMTNISGQYWINSAMVNAQFDADGSGLMIGQYRATPKESEPAYIHVNDIGDIDYTDITTPAGGAAMAWNADKTLFAMANGKGKVGIYEVTKDEKGVPSFTLKYEFDTTCGGNTNAIAFDIANNIYVVSNSKEKIKSFSLPRENGEVVVAAPSKYDVTISSDEYPAELFVIGAVTESAWNPEAGLKMKKGKDGVYTAQITTKSETDNIGIVSMLSADWEEVNANRWGMATDNAQVTLNEATPIVKGSGAILIGAVGTFDVTVDLKNLTILVAGEPVITYPTELYMIGNSSEGGFNPSDKSNKLTAGEGEGQFTIEGVTIHDAAEGYGYISFTATPGANDEDWATCNANRYGPAAKDTELKADVQGEIGKNGDTSYKVAVGTYDFSIDLVAGTITMKAAAKPSYPEALYMLGNSNEAGFKPNDTSNKLEASASQEGFYAIEEVKIFDAGEGYGFISFTATPGADEFDYETCLANMYGPAADKELLTDKTPGNIGKTTQNSYKVAAGTYKVEVDLVAGTITLTVVSGVDAMNAEAAKAIGGNGEIRIVGEAQSVTIYNMNGQAVVINSPETAFNVAKGVYVVVIDGNTSKVMVK